MSLAISEYDSVLHKIYHAALHPSAWQEVVSSVAKLFDARRALLFTWNHTPARGGFAFTHNISQADLEFWGAKSMHEDPFVQIGLARGWNIEGNAYIDSEYLTQDELRETVFYRELWKPLEICRLCTGIVFDGTDTRKLPAFLSLFRGPSDPPFDNTHSELLRRLLTHVSRGLGVMFHLRDSRLRVASNLAALERLEGGVVLLDHKLHVQFANSAASTLLRAGELFRFDPGESARLRLSARLNAWEQPFSKALRQAIGTAAVDEDAHFTQALVLPDAYGRPACVVHAAPLPQDNPFGSGDSSLKAIVFLYSLQGAANVDPQKLGTLFAMTPAEARAAIQLLQGGSIEEMAARLDVSANTLKTQLQAAYSKSGTNRQADLLKLLLALASH